MRKWIWGVAALVALALGANAISVGYPLWKIAREDLVGRDATLFAYHRFGVDPSGIVYDLWDVPLDASFADIARLFFVFADEMRGRDFDRIYLAYRGRVKFVMDGRDFKTIGDDRHFGQNPIYMVRTLPEKLVRPDGQPAFGQWTGGWLGVTTKQLEDLNEMHRQWYLDEMLRS
jgi:hypothetical protein